MERGAPGKKPTRDADRRIYPLPPQKGWKEESRRQDEGTVPRRQEFRFEPRRETRGLVERDTRKCYICGEQGHLSWSCPVKDEPMQTACNNQTVQHHHCARQGTRSRASSKSSENTESGRESPA
ncbi:hypothetical protein EOD39_11127 [Acipenser ruthenus]|uniref:CCHC-type domain-containing protein n=1 Tax=Acipenser ruthenus TaxID=7906 RepID=A0A444UPT7_ACIRT|nr:hypothetical protein EOD39_11127 [Acipenser ruthenus]